MWKVVENLGIEVNEQGNFRKIGETSLLSSSFNASSGFYEVNVTNELGAYSRRTKHTVVAKYFLNNGKDIPKTKKVVFKDGNISDCSASNLEIINKLNPYIKTAPPRKEVYINYGDEIYC